jgi:16S rRNA (guanine527-N7)-methyltransferase
MEGRPVDERPMGDPAGDPMADPTEGQEDKPSQAKADPDSDAELLYADKPIPTRAELRQALDWAFSGEEIASDVLERYADHAAMVLAGNQTMNLTAILEAKEVAAKHYLDCWRATRLLPLMGRRILDIGTGAGFPGIPVALAEPSARVDLIDSNRKRADFVARCIGTLGLRNVQGLCDRAEEHLARNHYDIVLVRALSSVRENVRLLRKVRHSLKDLVMLKGPSWSREMRASEREAERLGFRFDTVVEHELPEGMGKRAILVYRAPGAQNS